MHHYILIILSENGINMKVVNSRKFPYQRLSTVLILFLPLFLTIPAHAEKPEDVKQLTDTKKCRKCDLSGASLSRQNLKGADLTNANLRRADLSRTNLKDANLSSADLSNADLQRAELIRANFSYANLSGADLRDADLNNADLTSADLSNTNLSGVNPTIPKHTKTKEIPY